MREESISESRRSEKGGGRSSGKENLQEVGMLIIH